MSLVWDLWGFFSSTCDRISSVDDRFCDCVSGLPWPVEAQQEAEAKLIQARAQRESASILAEASKAGQKRRFQISRIFEIEKNWTPLGTTKSFFDDDGMQAAYPLLACQRVGGFRPWETTQLLCNFNGSKLKASILLVFCGTWFGQLFSMIHLIQLTWVLWLGMFTIDESL